MGIVGSCGHPYLTGGQGSSQQLGLGAQRAGGRGGSHKGLQANKPTAQGAELPVRAFGISCVLRLVMASVGTTTPLVKGCPSCGAIRHSRTATLQRPRPPPQPPVHPSPTSESPRTWSCFRNRETETFPCKPKQPLTFFFFFKKKNLCFHCWRKLEPSAWPQTGFPQADVLGASTHAAPKGRALGGSRRLALHQLFSHRSMNTR